MAQPWIMTQEWLDVTFFHWPINPGILSPHVPEELELDTFNGQAWLSIVPFEARGTRLRFMPSVPCIRRYLELNVRTYVRYGDRSGVYFFTLDADSLLAVWAAGTLLPYRHAEMDLRRFGSRQRFTSRRKQRGKFPETFNADYRVVPRFIAKSPLESWLTERYSLWTKPAGKLIRIDIQHEPWKLHPVTFSIRFNSLAAFIRSDWRKGMPLAHYASFQKVKFNPPVIEDVT